MGIIWEAYHKGVPLLGVPENPIETRLEPNEITEGLDRKTKQVSHSMHLFKNKAEQAKKSQPNTPSQPTNHPAKQANQSTQAKQAGQDCQ